MEGTSALAEGREERVAARRNCLQELWAILFGQIIPHPIDRERHRHQDLAECLVVADVTGGALGVPLGEVQCASARLVGVRLVAHHPRGEGEVPDERRLGGGCGEDCLVGGELFGACLAPLASSLRLGGEIAALEVVEARYESVPFGLHLSRDDGSDAQQRVQRQPHAWMLGQHGNEGFRRHGGHYGRGPVDAECSRGRDGLLLDRGVQSLAASRERVATEELIHTGRGYRRAIHANGNGGRDLIFVAAGCFPAALGSGLGDQLLGIGLGYGFGGLLDGILGLVDGRVRRLGLILDLWLTLRLVQRDVAGLGYAWRARGG